MTQRPDRAPLNEAEIDELESFIFSPAVSEESLDYLGIHGLLTSLAVSPVNVPDEEWLEVIFDGVPGYSDEAQQQHIQSLLKREYLALCEELNNEEAPELPCDLTLDDEEGMLTVWCQGFLEGVFLRESDWFSKGEDQVAELMLPIMMASELFDETGFDDIRKDRKLAEQLCAEIPDLITDLYLHFRVPEDKSSGKGAKYGSKKGRGRN